MIAGNDRAYPPVLTTNCYLCHFAAKTTSMFSITSSLFFQHLSAPILCSQHLPGSFHQNRGVGVQTMLPKSFRVGYSRYLQCSQQNTNSLHFFARSTLCSQHVPASFHQNRGVGRGGMTIFFQSKPKQPKKGEKPRIAWGEVSDACSRNSRNGQNMEVRVS